MSWINGDKCKFEELKGKIFVSIVGKAGDDIIKFKCINGEEYTLEHDQDCCEIVEVNDVNGDWEDLLNSPILLAEEITFDNKNPEGIKIPEEQNSDMRSFTWTFYKLSTNKGSVTIRWYGKSNGYYSETVDLYKKSREI